MPDGFPNFGFPFPMGVPPEFFGTDQPQMRNRQEERKGAPPASAKALAKIPKVNITADDIQEQSNKECTICLDTHAVGSQGCKLPCGHLFHPDCIEDWLNIHCTCPVCHFEIETDDADFERERKRRMRERKPRYRRDELEKKSITELREIMATLTVSSAGCVDKRDLVDRLLSSDKIFVVEAVPPVEIPSDKLATMSVQDIRHLLKSFGLSTTGAIEKIDLIQRLLDSGRVVIVNPVGEQSKSSSESKTKCNYDEPKSPPAESRSPKSSTCTSNSCRSDCQSNSSSSKSAKDDSHGFEITEHALRSMPIKELKSLMTAFNISFIGCVERDDIIRRFEEARHVRVIPTRS